MRPSIIALLLMSTTLLAQASDGPPPGCFFQCKEQFNLLDGFDQSTPDQSIISAFGNPFRVAKAGGEQIEQYSGDSLDLFLIRRTNDNARIAVAVSGKPGKAASVRIPFLHMIDGDKRVATLADTNLTYLKESCAGTVTGGVDARYVFYWTPVCYFGRPGLYMNYRFLFFAYDCHHPEEDAFDFAKMSCPDEENIVPVMAVVTETGDTLPDDSNQSHRSISSFVFWREFP